MNNIILLGFEFLKTGLFAIGGGLATLPFLISMSDRYPSWFTKQQLADFIAISESTPGAIGINMATFVGDKTSGILGGIIATMFLVLPSIIIIMIISKFMDKYQKNPYMQAGLKGLKPVVTGLITSAGYTVLQISLFKNNALNITAFIIFLIMFAATQVKYLKKIHPILYILIGAIVGIVLKL